MLGKRLDHAHIALAERFDGAFHHRHGIMYNLVHKRLSSIGLNERLCMLYVHHSLQRNRIQASPRDIMTLHAQTTKPLGWGFACWLNLPLLGFSSPAFNAFSLAAQRDIQLNVVHAFRIIHELVAAHSTSVGTLVGCKLQHRQEEAGDALGVLAVEVILLPENVR